MSIEETIELLQKKYGIGVITRLSDKDCPGRLTTGSLGLDIALRGGFVKGHLNLLWGAESVGKNFLAYKAIAAAQAVGGTCAIVSMEESLDEDWLTKCGVDVARLLVNRPLTLEEGFEVSVALVEGGADVVVVDSLQSISTRMEIEKSLVEDGYSAGPRKLNEWTRRLLAALQPQRKSKEEIFEEAESLTGKKFRDIKSALKALENIDGWQAARRNECCVIALNQVREAVGKWGEDEYMPGGRGIRHAAHVWIHLRSAGRITVESPSCDSLDKFGEKSKKIIGQQVAWEVRKSKFSAPGRRGVFRMFSETAGVYRSGAIDLADEVARYGLHYGIFPHAEGSQFYEVEGTQVRGRDAFYHHLVKLGEERLLQLKDRILQAALGNEHEQKKG